MSTRAPGFRNVPPPSGSKAAGASNRFIPREELGDFESWNPNALGETTTAGAPSGGPPATAAAAAAAAAGKGSAPPEPTAAEWQARALAARQAGYQDGYRDGLVALDSFKQSFASQATAQIGALLTAFDAQLSALDRRIADALAMSAVQLARQVLRTELQEDPARVAVVAGEAVRAVMLSAQHISVRVHPLDLPLVAEGADDALQARGARLVADATICRGGVLVESEVGSIDARIASRWALAAGALGSSEPWDEPAAS